MVHEHGLGGFKIGVGQIHFRDGANDLALCVDIQKTSEQASFSDVILFTRFFSYFLFAKRLLLFFSHREPLAGNAPGGNTP